MMDWLEENSMPNNGVVLLLVVFSIMLGICFGGCIEQNFAKKRASEKKLQELFDRVQTLENK